MKAVALAFVAAAVTASSAQAIPVINGSFEDGAPISGGSTLLSTGDVTSITGWSILPNGSDYVDNTLWDAQSGSRSVELSGFGTGGISQQIDNQFTPGLQYRISFWATVNPFASDGNYRAVVSASGGGDELFSYTKTAANSPTDMNYLRYSYLWTPDSASSTISFRTIDPGPLGIVIDNVSVSSSLVPEPATWALMLAGFGLTGFAMRRCRTSVVSA